MSLGVLATAVGLIGVVVPLLPTTPFLLLAAACFVRSSDSMYGWLTSNRLFGGFIRDYREQRGVSARTKIVALALLWGVIGYTALTAVMRSGSGFCLLASPSPSPSTCCA